MLVANSAVVNKIADESFSLEMVATLDAELNPERLISAILGTARTVGADQIAAWRKPDRDIHRLVRHDYVRSLRRNLSYRQVAGLVGAFSDLLPGFNREPVGMMSLEEFARMASNMKFHFRASPYSDDEGLALRGFYVTQQESMLKRPLIYVNTAHHPLAVSTTFCHELGHHLSGQFFDMDKEPVHFFFDADYAGHLKEPEELAADVMVSLAGYPEPVARKIFATRWNWGLVARAKNLTEAALNETRTHLKRVYGFDLMARVPVDRRLHYLSGMIHYAKLRWALLAEYDL